MIFLPFRHFILFLLSGIVFALLAFLLFVWNAVEKISETLPDVAKISKMRLAKVTKVYARDGSLLGTLYKERRYPISISNVPDHVILAFLAAEDSQFYSHFGFDVFAIIRAASVNLKTGMTKEGASTITQQLVKRMLLTPEKSYERKMHEILLAWKLERRFSKNEILEMYLNQIFFGENAYGIEAAAQTFFAKTTKDLTVAEAALLAGLPKAPSECNPFRHPEIARSRQEYVLDRLWHLGWISEEEYAHAMLEKPVFAKMPERTTSEAALWYLEETRRLLIEFLTKENLKALNVNTDLFGEDFILQEGLVVRTAMEPVHQEAAAQALRSGLESLARTHKRTKKQEKHEMPVQGAIVSLEVATGDVVALVGGYKFGDTHFNRATQARRQPGSSFKPIVYSAALDAGYTPITEVLDGPLAYVGPSGKVWRPSNFGGGYKGWLPLHSALAQSRNTCSVRLTEKVGIDTVIERAKIMGFEPDFPEELSVSLGAVAVSPLNMAQVYSVFANKGMGIKPRVIISIEDTNGKVLYRQEPERWRAISEENAYIMTQMMREVVEKGTGTRARVEGSVIAGKTGTTNKSRDAWFVGISPELSTAVYIGRDTMEPMNSSVQGGRVAAPIFAKYRKAIQHLYPKSDFEKPDSIVFVGGQPLTREMSEELEVARKESEEGTELSEDGPTETSEDQPTGENGREYEENSEE